ncbi:MAG: DsbA family protein [Chloroflexi bacterium]|nr:DsbA family protein [Chloroflexota bacterium]
MSSRRSSRRAASTPPPPPPRRLPLLPLSLAALVAGGLLVAVITFVNGSSDRADASDLLRPAATLPPGLADGRSLGSPDAPIHIEIWEDFQCPYCGRFVTDIEPALIRDYVVPGHVRLTYRDLVFLGQESTDAAVGARIAERDADAFWEFHDLLYYNQDGENRGAFSRDRLARMAVLLGMDEATFRASLDDPELIAAVEAETALGWSQGITSTPTLSIDGRLAVGMPDYGRLTAYLDELLAGPSPAPSGAAPSSLLIRP